MFFLDAMRLVVFGAFLVSASIALGSWSLRKRWIKPFGPGARLVRRFADPVLDPIESWLIRRGGNPHHAEWWLLGGSVVGGILVITLGNWLAAQLVLASRVTSAGPRAIIKLIVYYTGQVVLWSILIRVIASWFGIGRYRGFMRFFYLTTDWIIIPLRRVVPPLGRIDITPIVAWFLLQIVLGWLMAVL